MPPRSAPIPARCFALVSACLLAGIAAICPPATRAAAPAPVTEKEAVEIGKTVDAAMVKRDPSVLDALIDMDAVLDRVTAGISAPPGVTAGFKKGVGETKFGTIISEQLGPAGTYHFLRARGIPQDRTLLFRMVGQNGLNYHEYHLARDAAGKVRAADLDVVVTGEPLSQTLRRSFLAAVAGSGADAAKIGGRHADLVKHLPEVQQFTKLTTSNEPVEALKVYDALPASLRKQKNFMVLRLTNTAKVDGKLHLAAVAEFEKQYPGDPAGLLIRTDASLFSKDWDALAKGLVALDKQLGGDPYLDIYRARALVAQGQPAKAKTLMNALLAKEPRIADAYFLLIEMSLDEKAYAETARLLTLVERNLRLDYGGAATDPVFAGFAASPQGKKWLAERGPAGKGAE